MGKKTRTEVMISERAIPCTNSVLLCPVSRPGNISVTLSSFKAWKYQCYSVQFQGLEISVLLCPVSRPGNISVTL